MPDLVHPPHSLYWAFFSWYLSLPSSSSASPYFLYSSAYCVHISPTWLAFAYFYTFVRPKCAGSHILMYTFIISADAAACIAATATAAAAAAVRAATAGRCPAACHSTTADVGLSRGNNNNNLDFYIAPTPKIQIKALYNTNMHNKTKQKNIYIHVILF